MTVTFFSVAERGPLSWQTGWLSYLNKGSADHQSGLGVHLSHILTTLGWYSW